MNFKLNIKETKSGRFKGSCTELGVETVGATFEEISGRLKSLCIAAIQHDIENELITFEVIQKKHLASLESPKNDNAQVNLFDGEATT